MMSGRALLGSLLLLSLVVVATFALTGTQTTTARTEQILAAAAAVEADLIDDLGPNTTLHALGRVYRRHGPIADRLARESPEWYLPEWKISESWTTFDAGGNLVSRRSESRGIDGTIYQESWWEDGELVSRDVVNDIERRVSLPGLSDLTTADSFKAHGLESGEALLETMLEAESTTLDEATLDGQPVWVIERRLPVRAHVSSSTSDSAGESVEGWGWGYTLPYVADLDLVEQVLRLIVRQADYVLLKEERVGIGTDGSEYLLESRETLVLEVNRP